MGDVRYYDFFPLRGLTIRHLAGCPNLKSISAIYLAIGLSQISRLILMCFEAKDVKEKSKAVSKISEVRDSYAVVRRRSLGPVKPVLQTIICSN